MYSRKIKVEGWTHGQVDSDSGRVEATNLFHGWFVFYGHSQITRANGHFARDDCSAEVRSVRFIRCGWGDPSPALGHG